jgi:hypothetical protein
VKEYKKSALYLDGFLSVLQHSLGTLALFRAKIARSRRAWIPLLVCKALNEKSAHYLDGFCFNIAGLGFEPRTSGL